MKSTKLGIGPTVITLYVGEAEHAAYSAKAKRMGYETSHTSGSFDGETCGTLMWIRKPDRGVLLHECVHAVLNAYKYLGIARDMPIDSETLAYTLEHVFVALEPELGLGARVVATPPIKVPARARKRVKKGSK